MSMETDHPTHPLFKSMRKGMGRLGGLGADADYDDGVSQILSMGGGDSMICLHGSIVAIPERLGHFLPKGWPQVPIVSSRTKVCASLDTRGVSPREYQKCRKE